MVDQKQQTSEQNAAAPETDETLEGAAPETIAEDRMEIELETDAVLAARVAAVEAERDKFRDDYLRALAEVENTRRRAARDKADAGKYAISNFARDLLSVSDNLRRAVDSVDPADRDGNPAFEALIAGVEMTEKELMTVFERYGVKPIAALGEPFNPHVHEAMLEIPDETVPHGTVVHVLEPGFMIHDRPLRAARVGVSKGGPKRVSEDAAEPESETNVEPLHKGSTEAYEKQADSDFDPSGAHLDEKF
jgi:molecular chaperone GrpE